MATSSATRKRLKVNRAVERSHSRVGKAAFLVSGALAGVSALTCSLLFFENGLLRGAAVMNGSARGTALIALVVATPALVIGMVGAGRGSDRAVILWLGAVAYLLYNSVMFLLATPFNQLFLLCAAMFALSVWSAVVVLHEIDVPRFRTRFDTGLPSRALAAYTLVVVALNALAWLSSVVPAVLSTDAPQFLQGTGLTTNVVYTQDLSFWLPLMAVSAVWMWRRQAWGLVLVGAGLTMWVIESLGIAVDQTFGHAADPSSNVASMTLVPAFIAVALIGLVPTFFYYKHIGVTHEQSRVSKESPDQG